LPKLGHGALEATKKLKKRGASSLFAKSWQWRVKNNKKKKEKNELPFYQKLVMVLQKQQKRTKKRGSPSTKT
jgi:hypothetical protein